MFHIAIKRSSICETGTITEREFQGLWLVNRLTAVADVELPVDVFQVGFLSLRGNEQFLRYLLVLPPLRQKLKNL